MRKGLIIILGIAAFCEFLFAGAGFVARPFLLEQFGLEFTASTNFLGYVLAWTLLFIAIVCAWALRLVLKDERFGWQISYVL